MVFMFSFFSKFMLFILAYVLLRLLLCALLVIYLINSNKVMGQCINGSYYYKKDSDQVKEHQKMIGKPEESGITKRSVMLSVILVYIFACVLLCALTVLRIINGNKVIGEVYRSSPKHIKIGEETYTECNNPGFSSDDYGRRLGKVNDSYDHPMIIYKINCCENNEYIHARCCFEGYYFKKDSD